MVRSRSVRWKLLRKALVVTSLLLVAFIPALSLIPWNFSLFDPVQEVLQDFSYTDQYYAKLNNPQGFAPHIVLINIGGREYQSRRQLDTLLQVLSTYEPAVIGLDAYLKLQSDSASTHLRAVMQKLPQLVTGVCLDSTSDGWRVVKGGDWLGSQAGGYVNFVGDDTTKGTIRYFRPFVHQSDSTYLSWSARILSRYSPAAYRVLRARHAPASAELEEIRYWGPVNQFQHYEAAEVLGGQRTDELRHELRHKIVLLGAMGEQAAAPPTSLQDLHFTPLNSESLGRSRPDMYGVVIQANILSMLLRQDYVAATPWLVNWGLAFLVCLGFCYACLAWSQRRPTVYLLWSTPVNILLQLALGILFFYLGIGLYEHANLHLDVVPVLLALSLAGYVLAWAGVLEAGYKKRRSLLRRATGWYTQHRQWLRRRRLLGR